MPIHFTPERWERIRKDSARWWSGELKRPLIHMTVNHAHRPERPEPALPHWNFTSFYDLSVSAEAIVDRWDYELSKGEFLGDAFPCIWPNFGPGVAAAFLGCELGTDMEANTTWFHPREVRELRDLHFQFDPGNAWFRRIRDLCRAAMERWQGLVQVGMTDLGGGLDILASFRPGETLLMDLYDAPDEVKRCTWEIHEAWFQYFDALNEVLQPVNPGYTAWAPIYSAEPYYMLQCDFCYMIGPDMFDEFVKPELAACCARLKNAFYHLDGKGELPHLDSLLAIPELKGVQWVPGEGAAPFTEWPEVYRKIRAAGKLVQLWGPAEKFKIVADQLGSAEGLVAFVGTDPKNRPEAEAFLRQYRAMA